MSLELWQKLPSRILRKNFKTWDKLDYELKWLIVDLAGQQRFKCAFCDKQVGLEIEHDHYPFEGPGHSYTIHNVRGLACRRCNWHLMVYEKEQAGEYLSWENASSNISDYEHEVYIYRYQFRIDALHEALLEKQMGSLNYRNRRLKLQKLEQWKDEGKFELWREIDARIMRTPEQFFEGLLACMRFAVDEHRRDPNFRPPEKFFELVAGVRAMIQEVLNDGAVNQSVEEATAGAS